MTAQRVAVAGSTGGRWELPRCDDLGQLLAASSDRFSPAGGVLVLDAAGETRYGVAPEDLTGEARETVEALGWKAATPYKGWVKLRHPTRPMISVCLLGEQQPGNFPLLYPKLRHTLAALDLWHVMTGHPWYGTPGTAGSDVLEPVLKSIKPRGATLKPEKPGELGFEGPYLGSQWSRPATVGLHTHKYDANRMYLAGAGVAMVAPYTLKPTGPREFDAKLAGWWLIDVPYWRDDLLPDPAGYDPGHPRRWVTTPTAALLAELAEEGLSPGFEVRDAYVAPARRLFRGWVEQMNSSWKLAHQSGADRIARAVKSAAARETLGLFASPTYTTYRPDWWATIVATSRVNLWRKMRRIGLRDNRWPIKIETDCIWYESSLADPVTACPPGLRLDDGLDLGKFKIKLGGGK